MNKTARIAEGLVSLVKVFALMGGGKSSGATPMRPQYWVLGCLMKGPCTMSALGRRLQRSKPNMTAIVRRMLREGKVTAKRDAKDRRKVLIGITPKGRAFMKDLRKKFGPMVKGRLSVLTARELGSLDRSLKVVNAMMGKMIWDGNNGKTR